MTVTQRRIVANGLTFSIDEAGQGQDVGDAVALLLHGFPESRRAWSRQMQPLAELGWRVVAPDLRGYGETSRPAGRAAYRMEALIEDVAALFDALGARRRLLIGHDWGGLIAWAFAAQRARPLDGLVIINAPHPSVYIDLMRRSWRQRARSWYAAAFQLPWLPEAMLGAGGGQAIGQAFARHAAGPEAIPPALVEHYQDNAAAPGALTAMINYYRANALSLGRWGPGRALRIETPTLLIWGERDRFLESRLTQGYGPYVRDLTLAAFPAGSHWVAQEDPEGVNQRLAVWMAQKGLALAAPQATTG